MSQTASKLNTVNAAEYYIEHGFLVVPMPSGTKGPIENKWQIREFTSNDFKGGDNIGIKPSNGLVDIDLDCDEAVKIAPNFLPPTKMVGGRLSNPRSHHWYTSPGVENKKYLDVKINGIDNMLLERRASGFQTVVYPSTHPEGEGYIWYFGEWPGTPSTVSKEELELATDHIAATVLLARHWPNKGARQNFAMAVSGFLARGGIEEETVSQIIEHAAETAGDEEVSMRLGAVTSTFESLRNNGNTTGGPKVKEILGEDVGKQVLTKLTQWLRIKAPDDKPKMQVGNDLAAAADLWYSKYGSDWAYDEVNGVWFTWSGTHWKEVKVKTNSKALDQLCVNVLREMGLAITSSQQINTLLRLASGLCAVDMKNKANLINFKNGTLDTTTMHIHPHSKEDGLMYCFNYSYCSGSYSNIKKFLNGLIPDKHGVQALMAQIGLGLLGDTRMHSVVALIGPTRCGKSTCLMLVLAVCGCENVSSFAPISLFSSEIEGKRSRVKLKDVKVACVDELPVAALREEETFKKMAAHGGVDMRGIGKDEELDNQWKPKLILSMNEAPHYKDTTGAITQRLVAVTTRDTVPEKERDSNLFDTFTPELGAFAFDCIRLALKVKKLGYFPKSTAMKAKLTDVATNGNALRCFISECCVLEKGKWVSSEGLYVAYNKYCDDGNNNPLSKTNMSTTLVEMNIGVILKRERHPTTKKVDRGLLGIRLRTDKDPIEEEEGPEADKLIDDTIGFVDTVDDTLTGQNTQRQQPSPPLEVDVDTIVDTVDTNFLKDNPIEKESYSILHDTVDSAIKKVAYSLNNRQQRQQDSMKEPVEPDEYVDDTLDYVSTERQQSVNNYGTDLF